MNTEELKALGLTDEQVKSVFALHGAAIKAEQTKLQADLDAKEDQVTDLTGQIEQRDKDLKTLQKQVGDNETLNQKFNELRTAYDNAQKEWNEKESTRTFNEALTSALSAAKVRNPKAVTGLLDMDKIKLNDDKTLSGLTEQLSGLQETDAYLFDEGTRQNYNPSGGKSLNYSSDIAVAMKQEGFNLTKFLEEQGENN